MLRRDFEHKNKSTANVTALTLLTLGRLMEADPSSFADVKTSPLSPRWLLQKCLETLRKRAQTRARATD